MKPSILCSIALLTQSTLAIHLKISGYARSHSERLVRRGNIAGSSPLNNSADISYYTNITLNGKSFTTLIDTGSADLWVAGTVPSAQDTGIRSGVHYAVGQVEGPVKKANLEFASHVVQNQAFLEVVPDRENPEGTGLIGLGPSFGSNIKHSSNNDPGSETVLDRIFQQNRTTPNYLTVLLGRSDDPTDLFPGDITVGQIIPGYESITSQTKIKVSEVALFEVGDQHWQILLDEDGIVGPDGKDIPIQTLVGETSNKKQATAVLDTGFSLPQVPKSVSDAIYQNVPGAQYANIDGIGNIWAVPCDEEINLAFRISGTVIPIHPLDVSLDATDLGLSLKDEKTGKPFCLGAFQPVSFNTGSSPNFDIILGMGFLRNTYMLINFGDFVRGGSETADPYIQLLPITNDTTEAHNDFIAVRLNGVDNGKQPSNPGAGRGKPTTTSNNSKRLYTILAIAGISLAVLGLLLGFCLRRRSKNRNRPTSAAAAYAAAGWRGTSSYAPLNAPAPAGDQSLVQDYSSHPSSQYYQRPYTPQQGGYPNPFDDHRR